MSIYEFDQSDDLFSIYPSSLIHSDANTEFNPDDFVTILDQEFEKTANAFIDAVESVQTSSLQNNNNLLNFEESGKPVEQFIADGAQDRLNAFQDGVPRSEPSVEISFEEGEDMLGLEDEFSFQSDLQYTYDHRNLSDLSLSSTTTTSTTTTVQSDDAIERSSKSNQNGVAFDIGCKKVVDVELLHKNYSAQHSRFPSMFINSKHLSRPLYQSGSEKELDADDISLGNTLMKSLEGVVTSPLEIQMTMSQGSNDCFKKQVVNSKKRSSSMDKPRSTPDSPRKKKKMEIEEPLLQNLPGLQSVRVPNGFNEYSTFESVDEIDPIGDIENPGNKRYINYSYEIGPRARVNAYEPAVIRRKHTENGNVAGYEGLCPYCPTMKFLLMNTSAYLHHMTINHGVFSNGTIVSEPGTCIKQVLVNSGKKNNVEFFKCPYECDLKLIRMKKINPASPMECRYKVYLRHVKDCHGCGKRDHQIKRD